MDSKLSAGGAYFNRNVPEGKRRNVKLARFTIRIVGIPTQIRRFSDNQEHNTGNPRLATTTGSKEAVKQVVPSFTTFT